MLEMKVFWEGAVLIHYRLEQSFKPLEKRRKRVSAKGKE